MDQTHGFDNLSPHDEPGEVGGAAMATILRARRQHFQSTRDDLHMTMLQEIGTSDRIDPDRTQQNRQRAMVGQQPERMAYMLLPQP